MAERRRNDILKAVRHLRRGDAIMRRLIDEVGPCELPLKRDRFAALVHSIIGQQVSGKAAQAIRLRVEALVAPEKLSAAGIAKFDIDQLRTAGLSRQKATYLHDLCEKTATRQVRLERLGRMSDEAVIAELTQIKGVGRWTAEMLLIFSLGRLDVLPCDDLGVRSAIRDRYGLEALPNRAECLTIAQPWRPYASIASWYCWRSLDLSRR